MYDNQLPPVAEQENLSVTSKPRNLPKETLLSKTLRTPFSLSIQHGNATMAYLNCHVFILFYHPALLNLVSAATANDSVSPSSITFWENDTSIPQNFTGSRTYETSVPQNGSLTAQHTSAVSILVTQHLLTSLQTSITNTPTTLTTKFITYTSAMTSQSSSPTSTSSICPGEGKACGSRMSGNGNSDTLYSCFILASIIEIRRLSIKGKTVAWWMGRRLFVSRVSRAFRRI